MLARIILVTVEVICSFILIGLILLQQSKSEGLGLAFGAGMGESLFGSRAGNILTRLTVIFAVVFMINTLLLALVYSGQREGSLMSRFAPEPAARPSASTPATAPSAAAPVGRPTLPGAAVEETMPETPAPVSPAPESAPLVVEPIPAEE